MQLFGFTCEDSILRDEILKLLQQSGDTLQLGLFGLQYIFDFQCTPVITTKGNFVRIGANCLDMPIVVDPKSGAVYIVSPYGLCFINSTFAQMLRAFEFAAGSCIPDVLPDDQRAAIFRSGLIAIDSTSFTAAVGPDGFWAQVEEEIGMGII